MSNNQKVFFNRLAAVWDETRSEDHAKLSRLISMADFSQEDRVLDIGCGTGVLVPFLKAAVGKSGSITELDFSDEMIKRAKAKHGHIDRISYVVADILKYETEKPFSIITCLNFYPHIHDKARFFRHMHKLLADKGQLVIMHDISRAAVNAIHGQSSVVTEDRLPPADDVAELLTANGFCVENTLDNNELYFVLGKKM